MPALSLDDASPKGTGPLESGADELDLAGGSEQGLRVEELPLPPEDLPAPVDDLPVPAADLPTPVDDLPAPAADLPTPAVDLPTPAADLPTPAADLPTPAAADLPTPAAADLPTPAAADLPTPAAPDTGASGAEASNAPDVQDPGDLRLPKGPRPLERADLSRYRKPALAVLGIVLAGGVGTLGWHVLRGPGEANEGSRADASSARADAPPAAPRSTEVLTLLAQDRPTPLRGAIDAAREAGDLVGAAEAALLLHYRYGPDPVVHGEADAWLAPYADVTASHVARVRALAKLAAGAYDDAEKELAAEGPRVALYRAYLALARRAYEEAAKEAQAAAKADPKEQGARYVAHAVAVATFRDGAVEALEREAARKPPHPRLNLLLAETYLRDGRLIEADDLAAKIDTTDTGPGFVAAVYRLRGEVARLQGRRSAALMRLDQAREVFPADTKAAALRVRVLIEAFDLSTAKTEVELARKSAPKDLELQLAAAELAIATGHGDEALAILDEARSAHPDDPRIHLLVGKVHAMRMALDEATAAFERVRNLDPQVVEGSMELARLYTKIRRYDEAEKVLDEHGKALDERPEARLARADLAWGAAVLAKAQGHTGDALSRLDAALSLHPGHIRARLLRARLRLATGDEDGAAEDLEFLLRTAGPVPGLAGLYGPMLLRGGHTKKLADLIADALDDPRAPADLLLLGARLRLRTGKVDAAKALAARVLEREPNNWEAHLLEGMVRMAEGDPEAALLALQRARPNEPSAEVELWLGKALAATGRGEEALTHYKRALELDPESNEAKIAYGTALAARGAAEAAIELLRSVEGGEGGTDARAQVALGQAYRDLGRIDEAVQAFRAARRIDPSLREASYWEGRILAERNRHTAAVVALERAVQGAPEKTPWLPLAYRLLGRSYAELGRRSLARRAYETFLSIAPADDPGRAEAQRRLRDL